VDEAYNLTNQYGKRKCKALGYIMTIKRYVREVEAKYKINATLDPWYFDFSNFHVTYRLNLFILFRKYVCTSLVKVIKF